MVILHVNKIIPKIKTFILPQTYSYVNFVDMNPMVQFVTQSEFYTLCLS